MFKLGFSNTCGNQENRYNKGNIWLNLRNNFKYNFYLIKKLENNMSDLVRILIIFLFQCFG